MFLRRRRCAARRGAEGVLLMSLSLSGAVHGCAQHPEGGQADMQVSSEQHGRSNTFRLRMTVDGRRIELKAKDVEIAGDAADISAVRPGGYFSAVEERGGVRREIAIEPGPDGQLRRSYSVGGNPHPFDAGARAWLAGVVLDFARQSGVGAEARVRWLLGRGGATGVLAEVSEIRNNPVKRLYLERLIAAGGRDAAALARAIGQAQRELQSAQELAEFLRGLVSHVGADREARRAFFKAAEAVASGSERRRVLTAVVQSDAADAEFIRAALQSSQSLASEHERAEFLIEAARARPLGDDLRAGFLDAASKLQSSYHRGRVTAALEAERRP